jgi:hypothetical protein
VRSNVNGVIPRCLSSYKRASTSPSSHNKASKIVCELHFLSVETRTSAVGTRANEVAFKVPTACSSFLALSPVSDSQPECGLQELGSAADLREPRQTQVDVLAEVIGLL